MTIQLSYPEWEPAYISALMEADREIMPKKIADAEAAMRARNSALARTPEHATERHALETALRNIDLLKCERTE